MEHREHTKATVLDMEAQRDAGQAMRDGAGPARGRCRGASGLTGGEHGGFTSNLLQLLNEQGVHLPLQGPSLPAGTLGTAGGPLGAARAAGVRGHGAAAARPRLPGPGALGGPSASPRGSVGSPQRVLPGTGLLADGRVPTLWPRAGQLPSSTVSPEEAKSPEDHARASLPPCAQHPALGWVRERPPRAGLRDTGP